GRHEPTYHHPVRGAIPGAQGGVRKTRQDHRTIDRRKPGVLRHQVARGCARTRATRARAQQSRREPGGSRGRRIGSGSTRETVSGQPVIVDTNVVVAGLLTGNDASPVARVLDGMLAGSFPFVVSEALLAEYRTVL